MWPGLCVLHVLRASVCSLVANNNVLVPGYLCAPPALQGDAAFRRRPTISLRRAMTHWRETSVVGRKREALRLACIVSVVTVEFACSCTLIAAAKLGN